MNDITQPLRLAVGSHEAGSGRGCAMNLISWENGDTTITDTPGCSDRMLAHIVQHVNDNICHHRDSDLLCPACSIKVLDLGHRTVGTRTGLTGVELQKVQVLVACDQARQVLHLATTPYALAAIVAAEGWVAGTVTRDQVIAAKLASGRGPVNTPSPPTYALSSASNAAYTAVSSPETAWFSNSFHAAVNAASPPFEPRDPAVLLRFAHRAVDRFNQLTGRTETPVPAQQVEHAYACMTAQ